MFQKTIIIIIVATTIYRLKKERSKAVVGCELFGRKCSKIAPGYEHVHPILYMTKGAPEKLCVVPGSRAGGHVVSAGLLISTALSPEDEAAFPLAFPSGLVVPTVLL